MVCGRTRVLWGLDNVFELILMQSERIKTGGTGRTFEVPMCNHVQCSLAAFSAEFFGSVLPSARLLKLRCSMLFHYVLHGGRQWQWSSVCAQTVNRPPGVQGSYENHHIWPRLELDEYGTYGTTWGPFQRLPVPGCITLHHVASRCITLHHVASRCITLHHVASRCITLHHVACCESLRAGHMRMRCIIEAGLRPSECRFDSVQRSKPFETSRWSNVIKID